MNPIDRLIACLDGGVLLINSEYHDLNAYLLRVNNEGEASADSDFSILTPTMCAEFAYYEPDLSIQDRRLEMPYNPNSTDHPDFQAVFGREGLSDWPIRATDALTGLAMGITGLTIHHTLSDSPMDLFNWITRPKSQGGKGYPRGQYHYWVSRGEDAPIYHLLDDTVQCWHDHTGTYQTTLSIGMAGHLGQSRPPEPQLWNAVRLCAHLIDKYNLTIDDVEGHCDRAPGKTVCPGWYADSPQTITSGVWRRDFDIALRCAVDGEEWAGYNA
jgi:hypothetical protein